MLVIVISGGHFSQACCWAVFGGNYPWLEEIWNQNDGTWYFNQHVAVTHAGYQSKHDEKTLKLEVIFHVIEDEIKLFWQYQLHTFLNSPDFKDFGFRIENNITWIYCQSYKKKKKCCGINVPLWRWHFSGNKVLRTKNNLILSFLIKVLSVFYA